MNGLCGIGSDERVQCKATERGGAMCMTEHG